MGERACEFTTLDDTGSGVIPLATAGATAGYAAEGCGAIRELPLAAAGAADEYAATGCAAINELPLATAGATAWYAAAGCDAISELPLATTGARLGMQLLVVVPLVSFHSQQQVRRLGTQL